MYTFCKKCEQNKTKNLGKLAIDFTRAEICTRKILGILIILFSFAGIAWAPVLIPAVFVIGIYLLKSKRHHLFTDIFLLLIGLIIYYLPVIPLAGPSPYLFKFFTLSMDWTDAFSFLMPFSLAGKILIFAYAIFSIACNVFSHFQKFRESKKRGLYCVVILTSIILMLTAFPFFLPTQLSEGGPIGTGSGGCPPWNDTFKLTRDNAQMKIDSKNNLWIYEVVAKNSRQEDGKLVRISGQKPLKIFGLLEIVSQKEIIAPPFGRVEVTGGEKEADGIVVKPGNTSTIKITSEEPLYSIYLLDNNNCMFSFSFISVYDIIQLIPQEKEVPVAEESLDQEVRVAFSGSSPPGKDINRTVFKSGEEFHAYESGLSKGTKYGFRIADPGGVPITSLRESTVMEAMTGTGVEGSFIYNTKEYPLQPGMYRIELIKVENGKGILVAYAGVMILGHESAGVSAEDRSGLKVWVSKTEFGASEDGEFAKSDEMHPIVTSPTDCFDKVRVIMTDVNNNTLVEKSYSIPKGATDFGNYNSGKNLLPGAYKFEFLYADKPLKEIRIEVGA